MDNYIACSFLLVDSLIGAVGVVPEVAQLVVPASKRGIVMSEEVAWPGKQKPMGESIS